MNPTDTKDYMDKLKFPGAADGDTVFTGPFVCTGAGCTKDSVNLTVTPEKGSFHINWDEAFRNDENKGAIVAKFTNDTDFDYPPLQLGKHESAYMWVGPITNDGNDRAVAFYKINADGTAVGPITQDRKIVYCDLKNYKARRKASAKPHHPHASRCYEVTYNPMPPATKMTMSNESLIKKESLIKMVSYQFDAISGGTWISCMYGCCEVGGVQ